MSEHRAGSKDDDADAHASEHPTDFRTLILSLGSSALVHLGELEHPEDETARHNLELAKQTLDILSMLQEKTRGNLTDEEARLLEQLLYELRLKYVAARG